MGIRKDKIVVLDIEATCWEGFSAPAGQENEIIEIGLCLLNPADGTISNKRSILVTPTESVVSEFCTNLTTITQEMVNTDGIGFDAALQILEKEYDTRNRLWVSWGAFDRELFRKQCKRRGLRYPFSKKHANAKRVFQDNHGERMGLMRALAATNIEPEGVQHRADSDAYNTALVLRHLIETYGIYIMRRYGW